MKLSSGGFAPVLVFISVSFFLLIGVSEAKPKLGVYLGPAPYGPNKLPGYQTWLGSNVSYGLDFMATDDWWVFGNSGWLLGPWSQWVNAAPRGTRTLVLSIPMVVNTVTNNTEAIIKGANGAFNQYFLQIAQGLVKYNLSDSVLRIGWEFNGNWYKWSSLYAPNHWARFFQQVVNTTRSVPGQRFKYMWNPNVAQPISNQTYPGNHYVDYIGLDMYDTCWSQYNFPPQAGYWYKQLNFTKGVAVEYNGAMYKAKVNIASGGNPPGSNTNWNLTATAAQLNRTRTDCWNFLATSSGWYPFTTFLAMAKQYGKPLVFQEWGLWNQPEGHGGGDNPYYIQKMYDLIMDPANNVAWSSYFDVYAHDGNHQLEPNGNTYPSFPQGAKVFKSLFGQRTTSTIVGGGSPTSSAGSLRATWHSYLMNLLFK